MKKIIKSIGLLMLVASVFSCSESDNVVDKVLTDTVKGGGALRTITITSPTIALGSPTAAFSVKLEVQDINNGNDTDKIDVYASFKDNSVANGTNPKAEVLVKSISSSVFTPGPRGLLLASVSVTLVELQAKLALTNAQYTGGDQFVIRLAQVLKNGSVFTNTNSSSIFYSGYFNSPFLYNANVVCPITESLAGTHSYVTTDMRKGPSAAGVLCGGTATGTVTWTATATPGVYQTSDHSFGMYAGSCYGDPPATSSTTIVTWFCNKLVAGGIDQFSESFTYTITSVTPTTITLNWRNGYGDRGITAITRAGGASWPSIIAP